MSTIQTGTRVNGHSARRTLVWINVVGGIAVLGSYAWGIATHPDSTGNVWGGVPEWLKPAYTASMLSAAVGYFFFTGYLLFAVAGERVRSGERHAFGLVNGLYALILIPSALWMPLTFAMLEHPSVPLWIAIRGVLALVGLGSTGLLVALLRFRSRAPFAAWVLAVAGMLAFWVQTAVLDALVWPAYFP